MTAPVPEWPFTVRPEWIDYNGHMNMGYYVVAFDVMGTDQFFEWLGVGESYIARYRMSVFTLSSNNDYLGEMFEGASGTISTRLLDWDAKRIHFMHEMFNDAGSQVATNELLSMNVDLESRSGAPFPTDVQGRLAVLMDAHDAAPRPDWVGRVMGIRR